ncbi:MAG: ureidoglycolate lyase [Salinivirgaceae bacterium]|jgi:ureidoglycolate lyase
MRTVKIEQLSLEAYKPFGTYANLINPTDEKLGAPPVEFFRDQLQIDVNPINSWSYSCCRVEKRELVIDILEYHSACGEVVLPLDNDILLQVAPASGNGDAIPLDKMRVFYVPKGTAITIKPGVWHWGPFTTNAQPANILINLPERTYANDCMVVKLEAKDCIKILP